MRFLFCLMLFLQVGLVSAQDQPIGTYNPEEDQTMMNNSGLEGALVRFSELTSGFFQNIHPEGYVDGPFTNFFTFLVDILAVVLLHLLYAKVIFRKMRVGKNVHKMLYRYRLVLIAFAVLLTLTLIKDSFFWGILLAFVNLALIPILKGLMDGHMCPFCCSYADFDEQKKHLGIYSNEIYGTSTRVSQYLRADEITQDSLPKEKYKLYHVEKVCHSYRCPKCNSKWDNERWERIKEL